MTKLIATKPLVYMRGQTPSGDHVTVLGNPDTLTWMIEDRAGILATSECTLIEQTLRYGHAALAEAAETELTIWRALRNRECDVQGGDPIECGPALTAAAVRMGWARQQ